jgi:hypothetical protein
VTARVGIQMRYHQIDTLTRAHRTAVSFFGGFFPVWRRANPCSHVAAIAEQRFPTGNSAHAPDEKVEFSVALWSSCGKLQQH